MADVAPTPLARRIAGMIVEEGPIGIDRFMALCLGDPEHGYYMRRDPFGAAGDFITAPEISQMFGELIGLWAAEVWRLMGCPDPVLVVELGPGRGTLMADALRATALVPGFRAALRLHLVETSPLLRERQQATLAAHSPCWHADIETVPDGPAIFLANELLDALPIRQFVRAGGRWHERLVGLSPDNALCYGLAPDPEPALAMAAPDGAVLELAPAALALAARLAMRVARQGGAALLIDYGHDKGGIGDTLQAVRKHAPVNPLTHCGEADLTAHVDFAATAQAARRTGAATHGPVTQGALLASLGIEARANALLARADERQADAILAAATRLTDMRPTGMGALFKALAIADPALPLLPGFATRHEPLPNPLPEPAARP